jgi:iron-sulfur cluster repair protein YtfE (RIC family)
MGTPTGPQERLTAFGNELIEIHHWLRAELARTRTEADSYLDGRGRRPEELKAHCLSFCSALTTHHTSEDGRAFPLLAEEFPELRPVILKLEEDHRLVSGILRSLKQLLGGIAAEPDAAEARRVRSELDGLTAILESHFRFEERRIVAALNSLTSAAGTTEDLFGISVNGDA